MRSRVSATDYMGNGWDEGGRAGRRVGIFCREGRRGWGGRRGIQVGQNKEVEQVVPG